MLTRTRALALCFVISCGLLAAGCGGAQSRLAVHMKRGQAYFAQGNYSKASIEFRNALQIAPKDTAARIMTAQSAERLGQLTAAVGLYQAVIDSVPDNVEARADLGRLFIFAGAPERGLEIIKPALVLHPDNAALLALRAAAKIRLKDLKGAREDAERALQLAPTNEEAVALRAAIYQDSGDLPAAVSLVSGAVSKLPGSIDLREVLIRLYMAANDTAKAEAQLRTLIQLKPQEARYRFELARFYSQAHRTDDAQHVLEETVQTLPHQTQVKLALVDFLASQRNPAQAEHSLRAFIAQEPDNYELRLGLGTLLQQSGRVKEAIDAYGDVVRRNGTEANGLIARDRLANIALAQHRYDDARKLIGEVLQKSPRDNDGLLLHGELALANSDPNAAIGDFRAVLRDQPRAAGVQRLLAKAHLLNNEPALAEESLHAALDIAPTDISVRIELAQLLVQTQKTDAAVALLEETVRSAPTDAGARDALTRAYIAKRDYAAAGTSADDLKTLRPDSADGWMLASIAAEGQNRLDDAQQDLEKGLALQPRAFDVMSALAHLEQTRGRGAQAIALVTTATTRDPKEALPLNLLGELYFSQKNIPAADAAFTKAISLAPGWWLPHRNLALAKFAANDKDATIAAYQAGIKAAPAEPQLVAELALFYQKQGRIDDAIAAYEAWYHQNPRAQVIANNLAMLLATYKKDKASLDRARDLTASFASSNDGTLLDTNGWVHFKRAEYTDALPTLQRAAELAPDSKEIRYHLGMAELQTGQMDRARDDLQTAVSGSARFSGVDEARSALATLKNRAG